MQKTPMQVFNDKIRGVNAQSYLLDVIGSVEGRKKFVTSLVSVVANDANLQKCNPMSVIYAALKSVPLGLPIEQNLGFAAVIPYGENASFQIMRNGWLDLVMRTGQVKFIANEPVHEGELVKHNKFTGEYEFDENKRTSDKVIGYMAYIKLNNGFEKYVYWTTEEVKAHALRFSQTYKKGYGVWKDQFDAMALKTVLKHLIVKYCPKSAELSEAIKNDQIVTNDKNVSTYADNQPDEQTQPDTQTAQQKAEEIKGQVAAMRQRRTQAAKPAEVPSPTPDPAPEPQQQAVDVENGDLPW